jgi:integrase
MKLTDRFIQNIKCNDGERLDVPDDKVRGLSIRVMFTGKKSWSFRYRRKSDGKLRRVTIGEYPAFSLSDARSRAIEIAAEVGRGNDPAKTAKRPNSSRPRTFGELAEKYISGYAINKRTGHEDEQMLRNDVLPALEGEPLDKIHRADIAAILDSIIARGSPIRANRVFAVIRKCVNWGLEQGFIDTSPIARMKPPSKERSRDRVLSPDEIRTFWRRLIAKTSMTWEMRQILKLCLVTGQRVSEVAGATRSELNFDRAEWNISGDRAKNGAAHLVPLSPLALHLFQKAASRSSHEQFVLPKRSTGTPYIKSAPAKAMGKAAGIFAFETPITPHDLRRTLGTGLGELGYSRIIQDKVLNHVTSDRSISAVYDRYAYLKEKREALEAWADHLQMIIFDKPRAVVVSVPSVRRKKSSSPWAVA